MSAPDATTPPPTPAAVQRRRTAAGWAVLFAVAMVALVAVVGIGTRYGVLLPQARALIEARSSGLKIGRYGKLKIEGLQGDVFRDFTIRKVTIYDEKGTWLQADQVTIKWRYLSLLRRRLVIDQLRAQRVQLIRRPTLTPKTVSKGAPLSVVIRDARMRVETLPAFSVRRGLFDAVVNLDLERAGGQSGDVSLVSLLHRGDHLRARFVISNLRPLLIDAEAVESSGGALAGAAGLPADRPFSAKALVNGARDGGKVTVRVFSGDEQPAFADGSWTAAGGDLRGRARLSASSLLKSQVRMFGPEIRFAVAARKVANADVHGVAAWVQAENLVFRGKGLADFYRRSAPQGIDVDVTVPQLTRVLNSRLLGSGRATGRVNGSLADWIFRGSAAVDRVELGDYRLARVSGPLAMQMRRSELRVRSSLQGAGGSGPGLVASLTGRAPTLVADVSRLPDGRVLIRSARLVGAGVRVNASGARGLFGALTLKGDLEAPNLGMARKGAVGALRASWTASQGGGAKPWVVTFDGRGERLRTGIGELDRLLGPRPRLQASGAYQGGVVSISSSRLTGAAADANARGTISTSGGMKLAVDWRAKGPFQAGPVEISGAWSGKGALGGTLARPRVDLTAQVAVLDIPQLPLRDANVALRFEKIANTYDGVIAVTGASQYGPARARAAFRFLPGGVDLTGIDADAAGVQAAGALSLRSGAPTTADLRLDIGPGALLASGRASGVVRIVKGAGPANATIDLTATNAVVRGSAVALTSAHLTASGPLSRLPYRLAAEGRTGETPFTVNGSGVYAQADRQQTVSFSGAGEVRRVAFRTAEPIIAQFGPGGRSVRARIVTASGEAVIDARDVKGQLTANARLDNVDLKVFGPDFVGRIDANIVMQGRGERLTGSMRAQLAGANVVNSPANQAVSGELRADLADSRLTVRANVANAAGLRSQANVTLPTVASASPLRVAIVRNAPMSGDFDVQGEVKPLWDIFFGGDRSLTGQVSMSGTLGGSLGDPRIRGRATMTNGALEDYATGVKLTHLQADAQLGNDRITVTSLTANDNKQGKVSGSGTISLLRGGGSDLTFQLTNFRLIDNDTATANATGQITATRTSDGKVKIAGELSIDRAEINAETKLKPGVVTMEVTEVNRPPSLSSQLPPPKARGPLATLDIRLRAPRRVFVEGRGIRAELSMFAHVTGTTSRPILNGTARVIDGFYDFAGRRFQFEQRGSIRLSNNPADIWIDLSATASDPSLSVTIQIRGNASKPEITLSSSPGLPQDEILARLLFGGGASQLSTAQAAQVASVLSSLSAGGGFDVLGNLREFAGLDRLAFGADQTGALTVAGGKYVADNVYVEVIGGGVYGPAAQVEWRVRRNFSIVSTLGGQFGAKVSVRWRKDLGRERRRRDGPTPGGATAPPPPNRQ